MKLESSFTQGRYHRISVSCKDAGQFPRHLTVMGVKFEYEFAFGVLTVYECVFSNEVLQDSVKVSFECNLRDAYWNEKRKKGITQPPKR